MIKEIVTSGDIKIEKQKFHYPKKLINIKDIGVDKISLCKKGFKYLICCKDDKKVNPLYIMP